MLRLLGAVTMVGVLALASPERAAAQQNCASPCTTGCAVDTNCTVQICGCDSQSAAPCSRWRGGCGGNNPFPDPNSPSPRVPSKLTSVRLASASFLNDIVPSFAGYSGWAITVDSGVSDFTLTDSWEGVAWMTVLTSILSDHSLCWSTNSVTHVIEISNC